MPYHSFLVAVAVAVNVLMVAAIICITLVVVHICTWQRHSCQSKGRHDAFVIMFMYTFCHGPSSANTLFYLFVIDAIGNYVLRSEDNRVEKEPKDIRKEEAGVCYTDLFWRIGMSVTSPSEEAAPTAGRQLQCSLY